MADVDSKTLNEAIVTAIGETAIPGVDEDALRKRFGDERGAALAEEVTRLTREAASTPIEWGSKSLREGVEEILTKFHDHYPDLNPDALNEIGRCVGWTLR
ncbi:MAG: hypothetical protein QM774_06725 [Gordonia sp. (in: high G+C Gram-positive bacteria)]|uniref:hypothetical protein n=1 Tax=Gordonia sp. (in: high G+C Gram-positive bacteria) TaxID=84139 RepID=UPI0039E69931